MSDHVRLAVDTLQGKAKELWTERQTLRRRLLEDAVRDTQIDKDIAGCFAGASALGFEIDLPQPLKLTANQTSALNSFVQNRIALANTVSNLGPIYGVGVEDDEEAADAPEMPRIADIVLDRLTIAGAEGSKAVAIRRYILDTYKADIHEKTVGMTLYRLQKEEKVRRDGHTWFLAP